MMHLNTAYDSAEGRVRVDEHASVHRFAGQSSCILGENPPIERSLGERLRPKHVEHIAGDDRSSEQRMVAQIGGATTFVVRIRGLVAKGQALESGDMIFQERFRTDVNKQ
jgi:hypothetical protein